MSDWIGEFLLDGLYKDEDKRNDRNHKKVNAGQRKNDSLVPILEHAAPASVNPKKGAEKSSEHKEGLHSKDAHGEPQNVHDSVGKFGGFVAKKRHRPVKNNPENHQHRPIGIKSMDTGDVGVT